ncbi:MauE/DoxX family redox-associated membrane protein [Hwangdonia sp.]|uniref:MauE/DoxX family redox-associated membrane protein n=1 Tax=Hwangdonia sp. TaxID=1883432 RepID=UPI003AB2D73A
MRVSKNIYQIIAKFTSLLFLVLFLYAAISKLLDFEHFKLQLSRHPLISPFSLWIAYGVPVIELIIGILLLYPRSQLLAFYASLTLMSLFSIYIAWVLGFSDAIPCSCGGILNTLGWKQHLIFNLMFISLALIGILSLNKQKEYH